MTLDDLDRIESLPGMAEARTLSRDLLEVPAGSTVVDVGCGLGHAAAELAADGHRVIGVDADGAAIAAASARHPEVSFHVGDAAALPLADGEAHGYRASRVLHLVPDPTGALAEARRVLAPGGRAVIVGQDYGMLGVDGPQDVPRAVALAAREHGAGRGLRALLLDAGFVDVAVEVRTVITTDHAPMVPSLEVLARVAVRSGGVTSEVAEAWLADQARRGREDRFLIAWPSFFVSAAR